MGYKVQLRKDTEIIISKDIDNYEKAYEYSEKLISKLEKDNYIVILEQRNGEWREFRKIALENN